MSISRAKGVMNCSYRSTVNKNHHITLHLFSKAPGPALGPTQPPTWWSPGPVLLHLKRPGKTTHFHLKPKLILSGALLPLSHTPSCSAQGQLYRYAEYTPNANTSGTDLTGTGFEYTLRHPLFWRNYRGADKSLARPGRKQATATKL